MNNNFIAELINLLGEYNIDDYSIKKKDDKLIIKLAEAAVKEAKKETETVVEEPKIAGGFMGFCMPDNVRMDHTGDPAVDFVKVEEKKPKNEKKPAATVIKKTPYNGKDLLEKGINWVDSEIEKVGSFNKFCTDHGVIPSTFKYWYDKAKLAKAESTDTKEEPESTTDTSGTDTEVKEIVPEVPVEDTLYKGDKFTDFEVDAIKSYLAHEFTPKDCAELLNISTKQFHNMVNRFKRAKNLK